MLQILIIKDLKLFFGKMYRKAEFKWANDMKIEMVNKLLKANAPSLLLVYMRPIVANLT